MSSYEELILNILKAEHIKLERENSIKLSIEFSPRPSLFKTQ